MTARSRSDHHPRTQSVVPEDHGRRVQQLPTDPGTRSFSRWWMPGIVVTAITITAGIILYSIRTMAGVAWFEVGSAGWWVVTAVLHLPFFGILFFLMIGIIERLGFYWRGRAPEQPGRMPPTYPTVCVQLPMFNEHAVARRVIEAAANMRWPADRVCIQVLDDSTDDDVRRLVEQVSAEVRAQGRDCRVIHRSDRRGYKAGALEAGRKQTEAEFLVIFDADFVPPEDFLLRAVPHFYRPDGKLDTGLALVQAQWGHLNHNESGLTLAQSLWIDDHHTVQMAWRSAVANFVNFTGTAGVWRASAIETAGGWRADTLVEDGELSFRVLFAGFRTKFVKEIVVPAELPASYTAYKAQQKRWTQGWAQVQRLHLRTLLFDYSTSPLRRLQLFYLMCTSWQWPLWAVWMLLLPFAIVTDLWLGAFGGVWGVAAYLLPSAVWLAVSSGIAALATKHTYEDRITARTFMWRFGRLFPLAAISTGLLPHQVTAFTEGLFGKLHSEFERTPKAASVTRQNGHIDSSAGRHGVNIRFNQVHIHRPYVLSELFVVAYQLAWAIVLAITGNTGGALAAALVACCVVYLVFFYGDHAGNVCFVLDPAELVSFERIRFYVRVLATVAVSLILLSIGGQLSTYVFVNSPIANIAPTFYLDAENNLPTYFSVLLLLIVASLLAVIATRAGKQRTPRVLEWALLAVGFLVMALDEALQFHERLNIPVGTLLGDGDLGVFYYPWVIPGIALVFVLGLYFLRFLQHLPASFRFRFLMAAILYIIGAIGVELFGSHHAGLHGSKNWTYSMIATLEESLEISGLIMFIWALLKYVAQQVPTYREVSTTTQRPTLLVGTEASRQVAMPPSLLSSDSAP